MFMIISYNVSTVLIFINTFAVHFSYSIPHKFININIFFRNQDIFSAVSIPENMSC